MSTEKKTKELIKREYLQFVPIRLFFLIYATPVYI
jgi:hypothetical protein